MTLQNEVELWRLDLTEYPGRSRSKLPPANVNGNSGVHGQEPAVGATATTTLVHEALVRYANKVSFGPSQY